MKKKALAQEIRRRHIDAPMNVGYVELFSWFCHKVGAPPKTKKKSRQHGPPLVEYGDGFYATYEWRKLRMAVIVERGARCECCGASPRDGHTVINVDHIKPRKRYPALAMVKSNLQVLCAVCNHGKANWDETDWRPTVGEQPEPIHIQQEDIVALLVPDQPQGGRKQRLVAEAEALERPKLPATLKELIRAGGILNLPPDMTPRLVVVPE